ncbi:MAG: phospholipase D family protein, partial [Pseudomonadota bacterium]|nr:phospholipase D family protein [Pseudomonadota bacterium]
EALLARAWLANQAQQSIEVQYFIWSSDNIGILAAEALLRAAERGVKVRVIVDDLMIDAPDDSLLALSQHPNVDIRIYNPKHSVGTSFFKRIWNVFTDFRGVNQRMHDKTFIVDDKVAITGGRNMADEYFDYNHTYNFRDRDVLVMGEVTREMKASFNRFWSSTLTEPVEKRFIDADIVKSGSRNHKVMEIYNELHAYAQSSDNFEPEVRDAISNLPDGFSELIDEVVWSEVRFISDIPGKNKETSSLGGGGLSTSALAQLIYNAEETILIQSPYLVLSDEAMRLFSAAQRRGVSITISTNSLASTDNLQAFSGYKSQRDELIDMGIKIYEYRPQPEIQKTLIKRYTEIKDNLPIFAIHAKTMVVDSEIVFIGTYNLDPRSQNLNTEVGIIVNNKKLGKLVENMIRVDMREGNSWPASDDIDGHAPLGKRIKVLFWQMMPIQPLL